jgi:hypothetical protein
MEYLKIPNILRSLLSQTPTQSHNLIKSNPLTRNSTRNKRFRIKIVRKAPINTLELRRHMKK